MSLPPTNLVMDPSSMTAPLGQISATGQQIATMEVSSLHPVLHIQPTHEQLAIAPAVITAATISAKVPSKAQRFQANRTIAGIDSVAVIKAASVPVGPVVQIDRAKLENSRGGYSKKKNAYKTTELKKLITSIRRSDPDYGITTQGNKDILIDKLLAWLDSR